MKRVQAIAIASACTAVLALSACTGSDAKKNGAGPSRASGSVAMGTKPLVLLTSDVATNQRNFNPLSPSANVGTKGDLYEPLLMVTMMKPGVEAPWLATAYAWSAGGLTLTLTLRQGVLWSDGQPFTSKDVAYTFNTILKNPALNTTGLTYTSVSAPNANTVVLKWPKPGYAELAKISNVTPVPEHIFASKDPQKFTNPDPIGTGPFKLSSYSTQSVIYKANPRYWQADKITVPQVQYPMVTGNALETKISLGQFDWADAFVPNVDQIYVAKDKAHNHYWYPADGFVYLGLNQKSKNLGDVTIRKAISTAIDRVTLGKTAEVGYESPVSATGLILPAYKSYLDPSLDGAPQKLDVAAANALLDNGGYKMGKNHVRVDPKGTPLSYDIMVPTGFTDWVTVTKLLKSQLSKIGVQLNLKGGSSQQWTANNVSGSFDMTLNFAYGGGTPYDMYKPLLDSTFSAAIGKPAASNFVRWQDPATDAALAAYAATSDLQKQKEALYGIEKIMVNQVPLIPLLGSADWDQYRTANYVGWPDADHAYALGMPSKFPDNLLVFTHLTPVK